MLDFDALASAPFAEEVANVTHSSWSHGGLARAVRGRAQGSTQDNDVASRLGDCVGVPHLHGDCVGVQADVDVQLPTHCESSVSPSWPSWSAAAMCPNDSLSID
eukprot:CAMPEP_0183332884 /NCGR_PEP_ID=MMETSP0164_2-20130417/1943_1 /TAXON_ID=221442 /ORGANISM="Coccolithus pelagicus ssp braarudi, Strain PLY182g" /LENGTH=103 /DNA_ID=CAMNT_0025501693 /DNA_START=135 /DNA_END=447 /DNA_ORIENTATION=+